MHTEVVHRQLDIELEILPLTEACVLLGLDELFEETAVECVDYLCLVGLEERDGQRVLVGVWVVFGQVGLHELERLLGVGVRRGEELFHYELVVNVFGNFPALFVRLQLLVAFYL